MNLLRCLHHLIWKLITNLFPAGFSEDSDYTSEFNFPVNGQIPNAATSQYLTTAFHPRSSEHNRHPQQGSEEAAESAQSLQVGT